MGGSGFECSFGFRDGNTAAATSQRSYDRAMTAIAVLGLGEAGGLIAADLRAAGVAVRGYDPLRATRPDVATAADAAAGAGVVLSLTTAAEAAVAVRSVLSVLRPGQ